MFIREEQLRRWKRIHGLRRGRFEILAEVLARCSEGKPKSRIMYENNLSYEQLQNVLSLLLSRGMLAMVDAHYITNRQRASFSKNTLA